MAPTTAQLVIGVDTHADRHVAVALDTLGRHLATASFAASDTATPGYWPGPVSTVGRSPPEWRAPAASATAWPATCWPTASRSVRSTGPTGPGRRRVGKNDPLDAEHAAWAVLAGQANAIPKNRDGVRGAALSGRRPPQRGQGPHPGHQPAGPCWSAATTPSAPGWGGCASSTWPAPASGSAPPAPPNSPCAPRRRWPRLGHRDRRARPGDQPAGHPGRAPTPGTPQRRCPHRRPAAHHRRRQPGSAGQRGRLRCPGWDQPRPRREDQAAAQPRRRSPGQHRAVDDRQHPADPRVPHRAYGARRTAQGKTRKEIIRCLKRYIARELYPLVLDALTTATPTT